MNRKIEFNKSEYYHIYNKTVEERLHRDFYDLKRFFQSMEEFNNVNPIGSIYENSFRKEDELGSEVSKLVKFVCYCLNPNHYHFLIQQLVDRGVEKFMHRLGTGYTKYINQKYLRRGVLFQGPFKARHIDSNDYLLHLSAYINLNYEVHRLGSLASKCCKSSWEEYSNPAKISFCDKDIILKQFETLKDYQSFARSALKVIQARRDMDKLLLE